MKVLQVIDKLAVGGAEKVLVDLSNILYEHKHHVEVLCLLTPSVLDKQLHADIQIIYLHRGFKYNPIKLVKLYKILNRYDIIHIHCRQVMRYVGLLLFLPKFLLKFKVIFHDHYGKIKEDKSINPLLKRQLSLIDTYVGVSNELVMWFKKISKSVNAVMLSNIVRVGAFYDKTQKFDEKIKIVIVGNFRAQKNYEFALDLLAELPNVFELTIIGSIVDQLYYERIIKNAKERELNNRLIIKNSITNVQKELVAYDLAIHTATSETGPLVAIEYLAMQLPFIMFNTGEVAKQIQPELSDFIVDTQSITLWKEKINYVLTNKDSYRNKINSIFLQNFSEENYYHKCLTIYQNI